MFEKNGGVDVTNISMYVVIIVFIIIGIWFVYPLIFLDEEEYAPNRERSDPQSDWNIVEAIKSIKAMQRKYFSKFTQSPSYGI
jgi:hypothetical protein